MGGWREEERGVEGVVVSRLIERLGSRVAVPTCSHQSLVSKKVQEIRERAYRMRPQRVNRKRIEIQVSEKDLFFDSTRIDSSTTAATYTHAP